MTRTYALAGIALVALASGGGIACNAREEALLAAIEGDCLLDSDCEGALVCRFRRCHERCETRRDCPFRDDGDRQDCVVVDKPVRICQLDDERHCTRHSDCPGEQLCGADGACRNGCATARDCTPEQVCTQGTCADPADLEGGRLAISGDAPGDGAACIYHSDCPPDDDGLARRCRDGFCGPGCRGDDRDCGRFETCSTAGTDPPATGECTLIGPPDQLFCSPKASEPSGKPEEGGPTATCTCLPGAMSPGMGPEPTQMCRPDGSGYGPCTLEGNPTCSALP